MKDELWEKLHSKYGMTGYTDSLGIIKYDVVLELVESAEVLELVRTIIAEHEFEGVPPWASLILYELKTVIDERKTKDKLITGLTNTGDRKVMDV